MFWGRISINNEGVGTESVHGDLGGQKGGEEEGPGNPTSIQMGNCR